MLKKNVLLFFLVIAHTIISVELPTPREQLLIEHLKRSILNAELGYSGLNNEIIALPGDTGLRIKLILNSICSLPNNHYVEYGDHNQATFISALFNNDRSIKRALAISSEPNNFESDARFYDAYNAYVWNINYKLCSQQYAASSAKELLTEPIDIYFYRGNVKHDSLEQIFESYTKFFAESYIVAINDWGSNNVAAKAAAMFDKLGYKIIFEYAWTPNASQDAKHWWNGFYVAVARRPMA